MQKRNYKRLTVNYQKLAEEINVDIENGVYKQFPKLGERLKYISDKLIKVKYVINDEQQLTGGEVKTLIENGYIDKFDIKD